MILKKLIKKLGYNYFKSKEDRVIEELTLYEDQLIEKCLKYSMTTKVRMWSLLNSINYIYNNNIQGDFVECGVWKGGNLILYEILNQKYNLNKKVFGFDTFEGMPLPGEYDYKYNNVSAIDLYNKKVKIENNWCKSSLDEVKTNILTECSNANVNLIKGKVENTLLVEKNIPDKISILRLDTDFYESTKIELEVLFPKLEKNGILIIDDYGTYKGARKAVDEYFKKKAFLIYIDHTCRLLIKN
jgi:O-methyltransferase